MDHLKNGLLKLNGWWELHRSKVPIYALAAFISLLTLYLFRLAKIIEVVPFDTYEIYINAKLFSGISTGIYYWKRPPFLPWLLAPFFRFFELTTAVMIAKFIAVGIFSGLLALCYKLFRLFLSRFQAAAVVILLGLNALLLHFAPFVKEDIPATFSAVLFFIVYLRAREERKTALYAASGLILGLTAVTRFNMFPWIMGTIALYEFISSRLRAPGLPPSGIRDEWRKFFFLFFFPAAFFLAAVSFSWATGNRIPWSQAVRESSIALWALHFILLDTRDNPVEIFLFLQKTFTWPLLLCCAAGIFAALKNRDRKTLFMGLWLSVFLTQQSAISHQEARYLFPVFPPVCFFIIYGAAAVKRALLGRIGSNPNPLIRRFLRPAAVLAIFFSCLPYAASFTKEIRKFRDPFYTTPFARDITRFAESLAGAKNIFWVGKMYPLHPDDYIFHPLDEASYIYHFYNHAIQFYTDKRVWVMDPRQDFYNLTQSDGYKIFVADIAKRVADGDVCIINPNSSHFTARDLPRSLMPLWVQKCKTFPLVRSAPATINDPVARFTGTTVPMTLQSEVQNGRLHVKMTGVPPGTYQLYVHLDDSSRAQMAALFDTRDGNADFTVPVPAGFIRDCFLLTFEEAHIFPHPKSEKGQATARGTPEK